MKIDVAKSIGTLDRSLSELKLLALDLELDEADAQTVKHHAEDCVGLGNRVLEILQNRSKAPDAKSMMITLPVPASAGWPPSGEHQRLIAEIARLTLRANRTDEYNAVREALNCSGETGGVLHAVHALKQELEAAKADVIVLEADCHDGKCMACCKCCDKQAQLARDVQTQLLEFAKQAADAVGGFLDAGIVDRGNVHGLRGVVDDARRILTARIRP